MKTIEYRIPDEITQVELEWGENKALQPVRCVMRSSPDTSREFTLFAYGEADLREQLGRHYPGYKLKRRD